MLDLFFPPTCLGCERLVASTPAELPLCTRCSPEVVPAQSVDDEGWATAVFGYEGPIREALHRLKYGRQVGLAAGLGRALGRASRFAPGRFDLITPVPLHRDRMRGRGFNQSALLVRNATAHWPRRTRSRVDERVIERVRATDVQADLPRAARAANVEGAFRVRPRCATSISGKTVLIVDDVLTTGATLRACCRAIEAVGGKAWALALLQSVA